MRVVILTEGLSEYKSLPRLYSQLLAQMPKQSSIKALRVNVSPDSPRQQLVAACKRTMKIAAAYADLIVVLLDREQQSACPGDIATELERGFKDIVAKPVRVVFKDAMFENWLIADLDALRASPARFSVTNALQRKVEPNKADSVKALDEIKRSVLQGQYEKVSDSDRICKSANIDKIALHSRSFRHFLHIIDYEPYRRQCRQPVR